MAKFDGALVTMDTINEHLRKIQETQAHIEKFGASEPQVAFLNSLNAQSTRYLTAAFHELERKMLAIQAYDDAVNMIAARLD